MHNLEHLQVTNNFSSQKNCKKLFYSLEDPVRRQILNATAPIAWARIHPSQCQILTLATDGQVSYWEAVDGTEIRSIVLGKHSTVTSLDVSPKGDFFLTSTIDSYVKVQIGKCSPEKQRFALDYFSGLEVQARVTHRVRQG